MTTACGRKPLGVVSKTDIMGAYYAGLPVETRISDIRVGPPYVCTEEETLETAIDLMQTLGLQRIFVAEENNGPATGVLSLSDAARFRSSSCRARTKCLMGHYIRFFYCCF